MSAFLPCPFSLRLRLPVPPSFASLHCLNDIGVRTGLAMTGGGHCAAASPVTATDVTDTVQCRHDGHCEPVTDVTGVAIRTTIIAA